MKYNSKRDRFICMMIEQLPYWNLSKKEIDVLQHAFQVINREMTFLDLKTIKASKKKKGKKNG